MNLCSRVFCFGDYATHCFGQMILGRDGSVQGYEHEREERWQFVDGELRFLMGGSGVVTSRLRKVCEDPILFHGSSTATSNRLYLRELLSLESLESLPADPTRPPLLINTVPKSGTYWLRRAFTDLGFQPTNLHLGDHGLDDNRGLADDPGIHRNPWSRRTDMPLSLLASALPQGSVTVGHISNRSVVEDLMKRGVMVIQLVRDLRAVLEALFHFKLGMVDPAQDHDPSWRHGCDPTARFLGFLRCYHETDLALIARCFRSFAAAGEPVTFRYEDLAAGHIDPNVRASLVQVLGCQEGPGRFRHAVLASFGQPTSTIRGKGNFDPWERRTIQELAAAYVAGSELAGLNGIFGYEQSHTPQANTLPQL